MIRKCLALMIALCMLSGAVARAEAGRRTILLDGTWSVAEGTMDKIPARFDRQAPVPGLADMATPPFEAVGVNCAKREAFWYRRTFTIEGKVPTVAILKIRQVLFGSKVILNGQVVGEQPACFTPAICDVSKALKGDGAENVLLVRVCAHKELIAPSYPSGEDGEKLKYIPGIFDSVELILSGTPNIVNVQVAPLIGEKTARVVAQVRNAGAAPVETKISFEVREARSGRRVGQAETQILTLAPGEEKTVEVRIPIAHCRLWSPEDPFLYELRAGTGTDTFKTRFGMREFRFDQSSGRAVLNGRPFFMRGSNVCIFRFCEDPARANKPWREEWVRRLHRKFKEMHWDCLRYCIGFPPEIWYRIADEEGFLIQDEFPIWTGAGDLPQELTLDELAKEYSAWMRERWNHPCVVIWDAQNESNTARTGAAIQRVRKLDLSGRPWDNGFGQSVDKGDSHESHTYHFSNPDCMLDVMAGQSGAPEPNMGGNKDHNAIILNEYGWLWLNRDGSPTTLTKKNYEKLLGVTATDAQRYHLYARYMAAETEFWRAHRKCAAVLHFCGLGYSRPDGQTSDDFIDLEKLTFEPEFQKYVGDAFAPVGLMLDFWAAQATVGEKATIPVMTINDLYTPWQGTVRLRLRRGGRTVLEKTAELELPALGERRVEFPIEWPKEPGDYQLEAALVKGGLGLGKPVRSLRDFRLLNPEQTDAVRGLSLGCQASASSELTLGGVRYGAAQAFDGQPETRWSSAFADGQWLAVDLGREQSFTRVELDWEAAFAKEYAIEISSDGKAWQEIYHKTDGKGGTEECLIWSRMARWVRLKCIKRATPYGFSLHEMKVFRGRGW